MSGSRPKLGAARAAVAVALLPAALAGCGGDDTPEPSIDRPTAEDLLADLQRVQDNVDNGSCLVAEDEAQDLQTSIEALPANVNADVKDALQRGALNLAELTADPDQCERDAPETTTTEETTTDETTTDETTTDETTTQETTTTPPTTPTVPQPPPNPGGGVSPGDGL